jgi:hypothetical protein
MFFKNFVPVSQDTIYFLTKIAWLDAHIGFYLYTNICILTRLLTSWLNSQSQFNFQRIGVVGQKGYNPFRQLQQLFAKPPKPEEEWDRIDLRFKGQGFSHKLVKQISKQVFEKVFLWQSSIPSFFSFTLWPRKNICSTNHSLDHACRQTDTRKSSKINTYESWLSFCFTQLLFPTSTSTM